MSGKRLAWPDWTADRTAVLVLGLVTFVISLARVPSWDEVYWLTIARRVLYSGDLPYFDLLDNKGPLLYPLVGVADLLPFSTELGMALLFSATCVTAAVGALRVARSAGTEPIWARWITVVAVMSMAALSTWAVTVELVSAALLLTALAVRSDAHRFLLCTASALVDTRSAVLGAVILLFTAGPHRRRYFSGYLLLAAAAAMTVVSVPELRLAFIDYSLSNRAAGVTPRLAALGMLALAPFAAAAVIFRRPPASRFVLWLTGSAVVLGAASLLPFAHYFTLVMVALPLLVVGRHGPNGAQAWAAAFIVIAGISAATATEIGADRTYLEAAEAVLPAISDQITPEDRVAVWSANPHFSLPWAAQTIDFAPSVTYLGRDLPQHDALVRDFVGRLETATVVIVAAPLDAVPLTEYLGDAQREVARLVESADCRVSFDATVLYRFDGC